MYKNLFASSNKTKLQGKGNDTMFSKQRLICYFPYICISLGFTAVVSEGR